MKIYKFAPDDLLDSLEAENRLLQYCFDCKTKKRKGDTQQSQVIRKALEMYFEYLKVT